MNTSLYFFFFFFLPDCDSYDYNEIPYFVDDVPSVIAFSYQQSLNACLAICTSEPHCVVVSYIDFIGSCIRMNYYNASKQTTVLNTKSYIKECVQGKFMSAAPSECAKCTDSDLSSTCTKSHPGHYENTPIQIFRKYHLQKLKIFR